MKHRTAVALAFLFIGTAAVPANAEETQIEWPFGIAAEDVTVYTRPDHVYTDLEGYSDRIIYDLPYCGENSTGSQILHLVLPDEQDQKEEKMPLLMFIHGGSWSVLNSADHCVAYTGEAALWALKRGYAVAFVDYTLVDAEHKGMPNQIYEVKAALRYLRSAAEEYNLDPDKFAAMGESAGGHLADMLGTTIGETQYDVEEYGNTAYSSDVQAIVAQYSISDIYEMPAVIDKIYAVDSGSLEEEEFEKLVYECSPLEHVDGNEPPFFIEAGLEDTEVPYTQSCSLYNALMKNNEDTETVLYLFPGMDHAVTWFQTEENAALYLDWLDLIFER